jgi:hypothetical protein
MCETNWIEQQNNVDILSMGQKITEINFECWRIPVAFAWSTERIFAQFPVSR